MGRFYKTASASPLDYMHRINAPLMERALQFNDQAISAQADQGQAIGSAALNFKRLADDDPDAALIAKQYNDQVDQLSKTMAADPANWRKQMEPLRNLKKDIMENYTTGPIAKMQANYGTYQAWKTKIDKAVEKGTIDPNTAKVYEDHYLANWRKNGATGFKNGRYNVLRMDDVMANRNITKELSEGVAKLKASGAITESIKQPGMYMIKTSHGEEEVSPDRVLSMAMSNMSPELQQYMKSRQGVGLMHGIYGEDGNMITPYTKGVTPELVDRANRVIATTRATNPAEADKLQAEMDAYLASQKNKLNWNPNSGLAPILKGIVEGNSWMKTTDKIDVKADPVKLPTWLQGRREIQQSLNREVTKRGQDIGNENADARLAWEKEKFELQQKAKAGDKKAQTKLAGEGAKAELGLINNPNYDYEKDLQSAAYDPKAKLRAKTTLDEANTNFLQGKDAVAKDYVAYLGGRKSTEETAKAYVKAKSVYGADQLGEVSGRPISNLIDNTRWLPSSLKTEGGQEWDKIYKTGQAYNKAIDDVYERNNNSDLETQVNPLTPAAQTSVATIINNNPSNYFSIDDKTGERQEVPKIKRVLGGVAGNSQSRLGFQVELENGTKKWVFPGSDEAITEINTSYLLDGVADKKSSFAAMLKNRQANDILADFRQGVPGPQGLNSVIRIGNHELSATLTGENSAEGAGKVVIRDESGAAINTFENISKFVESYNQAIENQKKK